MPRFANLKGSMNPFDNNKPVLSSSDRIRNKKSKYIYAAAKQEFQTKRHCNGKNIKYYKKGTVRSVTNYKLQQDLAIGNALCEDCDNKGTLCGPTERTNLNKIEMGNNKVSEFWGGGGLDISGIIGSLHLVQTPAENTIQSDISGSWEASTSSVVFVSNLIKIPRNLNGNGITIDPSNILFPINICDKVNELSNLKTFVKITGAFPIHTNPVAVPPFDSIVSVPGKCNDISYNSLPGSFFHSSYLPLGLFDYVDIFSGYILSLCCVREQMLPDSSGQMTEYGIFDMHIELFKLSNPTFLSVMVNYTPQLTSSGWSWSLPGAFGGEFIINYQVHATGGVSSLNSSGGYIESVKVIQGTVEPSFNQTKYNATKQSYLSCLEDGTKKINLTKNTMKNNIVKAYCKQ